MSPDDIRDLSKDFLKCPKKILIKLMIIITIILPRAASLIPSKCFFGNCSKEIIQGILHKFLRGFLPELLHNVSRTFFKDFRRTLTKSPFEWRILQRFIPEIHSSFHQKFLQRFLQKFIQEFD